MDPRELDVERAVRRALSEALDSLPSDPRARERTRQTVLRRVRRPRWVPAAASAAAAAAVIAFLVAGPDVTTRDREAPSANGTADRFGDDLRPTAVIGVGDAPVDISVGGLGYVWVANRVGHSVTRLDPDANGVLETVALPSSPGDIAIAEGPVWVALPDTSQVALIDTAAEPLRPRIIDVPGADGFGLELTVALDGVWVVAKTRGVVHISRDGIARRLRPAIIDPVDLAVKDGSTYVLDVDGTVIRHDLELVGQGDETRFEDCFNGDLVHAAEALWCISDEGRLFALDLVTGQEIAVPVRGRVVDLAVDPKVAWVVHQVGAGYFLTPLDRTDGSPLPSSTIELPGVAAEAAIGSDSVWVALPGIDQVVRYPKTPGS